MQSAVYIISGMPGAGISTVAGLLARRFERGVHVEADLVQQMIVAGGVRPEREPAAEAARQFKLRRRNVSLLASSFLEAGFTVVIDDIVVGTHVDEYRAHLRSHPLLFVMLIPQTNVIRAREASRNKHVFDLWAEVDQQTRTSIARPGLWLDTSDQTVEETVEEILRQRSEAVID